MSLSRRLIALICTTLTMLLILSSIHTAMNKRMLESFARQLYEYELPPNTTLIEQYQLHGELGGNDHKEHFMAAILLKTQLSEEIIKGHYFKGDFKSAKKEGNSTSIEILKPQGMLVEPAEADYKTITLKSLENESDLEDYMLVIIKDGGYEGWLREIVMK